MGRADSYPDIAAAALADTDVVLAWQISPGRVINITLANLRDALATGAISTVSDIDLTASRALASNAGGKIAVSTVTSTELGYLSGVTAALQTQINALLGMSPKNLLRNGNFDFWDKGTTFNGASTPVNNDATYLLPGWCLLSEGNDIADVTQETATRPNGSQYYIRFALQSSNKKFGIVQHMSSLQAIPLKGKTVSLSFKARSVDGSIGFVDAAILSWTSTADSPTRDIVSSWGTSPPTFAANYTTEASLSSQAIDNTWQTVKIEATNIAASLNNLAIFICVTLGLETSGDSLDIGQVQLEISSKATEFVPLNPVDDRKRCNRYYWRVTGDASGNGPHVANRASGAAEKLGYFIPFPAEMWKIPTPAVNGTWALSNCTGPTAEGVSAQGFNFTATASGAGAVSIAPNSTDDYIEFDAEL